ncbi:MAG: hypothetical protein JWR84_1339 [Caulobacter sp.]|nr:hypothetical protein [Caulobacter sp.]
MTFTSTSPGDGARRILNCLPSPDQTDDWTFGAAVFAGVASTALPPAVDLRDDSWWPVGNQHETGSCVGWATADGLLRYHFSQAGWIAKGERLSTRFTWMASKELDEFTTAPTTFIEPEGTSLKASLDVSRRYGAVLDEDLPFEGGRLFPGTAQVFYTKAARLKIANYTNLGPSLVVWRRWLANNGPILVRLDVDATWANGSNQPTLDVYRPATANGGHAVALVGYTPEGFIVRNSWGDDWGQGGYVFATDAYAAAAFTEAYGVVLGGVARVAAGIADSSPRPTRKRSASDSSGGAPDGSWGKRAAEIEALLLETVQRMQGRPFGPLSLVSSAFGDVASLTQFLRVVETALEEPGRLTSAAAATLEHLRQGFFDELADWAYMRLQDDAAAAPDSAPAAGGTIPATITRDPSATIVFINGVSVPQDVSVVGLHPGANRLRVRIHGAPGAEGIGGVVIDGDLIANAKATIPPGRTLANSNEETFDV